MPEVEHTALIAAPLGAVWNFVRDMGNWAPYIVGYQDHKMLSDTDSVWTLKGEVGGLTRTVQMRVHITEWNEPEQVTFALEGINEPMAGSGSFLAAPHGSEPPAPAASTDVTAAWTWWKNIRERIVRLVFDWIFHRGTHRDGGAHPGAAAARSGQSQITFKLALHAGGVTGPVINVLVAPLLKPVAEELANKIAARVEELQVQRGG